MRQRSSRCDVVKWREFIVDEEIFVCFVSRKMHTKELIEHFVDYKKLFYYVINLRFLLNLIIFESHSK